MTSKEAISEIKTILGLDKFSTALPAETVNLDLVVESFEATAILEDGETQVYVEDEFVAGAQLSVIGEDGSLSPAPEGTHVTQEGITITVDAEGVILEVTGTEEVEAEVEKPEAEAEEMEKEEEKKEFDAEMILGAITELLEDYKKAVEKREEEMKAEFTSSLNELKEKFETLSNEPAAKPIRNGFSATEAPTSSRIKRLREIRNEISK